jgi:hypothetical protein
MGPARKDSQRHGHRKRCRDQGSDVGYKAKQSGQNPPEQCVGNSDQVQTDAEKGSVAGIHQKE